MPKKKILIVEDEEELNEAYAFVLDAEGYEVTTAFNGEEGLEAAELTKPDLILLDLRMPVMDGLGFLREYKKLNQKSKIIIFSNYDLQQEIDEAFKLGAGNYVLKAMTAPKELVQMVKKTLEN